MLLHVVSHSHYILFPFTISQQATKVLRIILALTNVIVFCLKNACMMHSVLRLVNIIITIAFAKLRVLILNAMVRAPFAEIVTPPLTA